MKGASVLKHDQFKNDSVSLLNDLTSKYATTNKRPTIKIISFVSAAASVILLIGLFFLVKRTKDNIMPNKVAVKTVIEKKEEIRETISEVKPVTETIPVKKTELKPKTTAEKEPLPNNVSSTTDERPKIEK